MIPTRRSYENMSTLTEHITYENKRYDIERLQQAGGGIYIYGVHKSGTYLFISSRRTGYDVRWLGVIQKSVPNIEWYIGDVQEGCLRALGNAEVVKILTVWDTIG